MLVGILESLYRNIESRFADLSAQVGFEVQVCRSVEEFERYNLAALLIRGDELSAYELSSILKNIRHVLILNPKQAYWLITETLAALSEESEVEFSVVGPEVGIGILEFLDEEMATPYYVRVVCEQTLDRTLAFESFYQAAYWSAYFADSEIRKIKFKTLPAVNPDGVLLYARTESAMGIPVDLWYSNLGFSEIRLIKIYSQESVAEVDCLSNRCQRRSSYSEERLVRAEEGSPIMLYVESFIRKARGEEIRQLNVPARQFMKIVDFYNDVQRSIEL